MPQFLQWPLPRLPRLQQLEGAWETIRSALPPCTERDEKVQFAKNASGRDSRVHDDTELSSMGGPMETEEGAGYANFGGGAEPYPSDTPGTNRRKMNGNLGLTMDEASFDEFGGGEGGEFEIKSNISEWQAGWNVTNAIQGMFIVSLPYAVKNGGYWAIFALVFVAYICCHTGKILVECLYDVDESGQVRRVRGSYVDIASVCLGRRVGAPLVNCAQIIELLMTCILYVVLCGDLMIGTFPGGAIDQRSWMMVAGMLLLPCAFLKTLRSVSFLSFWCTMVHVVINIIVVGYCLTRAADWAWGRVHVRIDIFTFPISQGIVVFSYTSQVFLPTLEGCMRDRSRFNCMLDWSHVAAAIFKATFAYVGYLTWAEATDEVITNNLPTQGLKGFVNFILVVKAMLSYPLPFFAALDLLETAFFKGKPRTFYPSCYERDGELKVWALALRLLVVLSTVLMAITIPHFAILMGFIGSFTGTMLSFVWPAYFHLKLKWDTLPWYVVSIDVFIICLGIVCGTIGMYYSGRALVLKYRINLIL